MTRVSSIASEVDAGAGNVVGAGVGAGEDAEAGAEADAGGVLLRGRSITVLKQV